MRTARAEELDRMVDDGEDITAYMDLPRARRFNQEQRKVNVDFNVRQLAELDEEAAYLSIPRQAVIKTLLDEALTARRARRRQSAA